MNKSLWIFIFCVLASGFSACQNQANTVEADKAPGRKISVSKITASDAIAKADKVVGSDWKLAFVSNTGVTSSATSSDIASPDEGLMEADGTAGQWVIEYFKNEPKSVSEGGRTGKSYPLRRVIVTASKASELAKSDLAVPEKLSALNKDTLKNLDAARQLALSKAKAKMDLMSVASNTKSSGETTWTFRFYDVKTGDIVENITISGDGKTIVK